MSQPQTTVIVTPPPAGAACRDDSNPIGTFGCDKRVNPGCCVKFFCSECTVTNYEGLSLLAIIGWILMLLPGAGHGLFGLYVCCCYQPPLLGVHYGKPRINVVGGPVNVVHAHAGEDEHLRYDDFDDSDDERLMP
ncbi:unnamed protein product [Amoebophrya sp. A120]|nr:unnamed protein product [Amoebophrya sp. A120]|eukprot:GSA120T00004246001.1